MKTSDIVKIMRKYGITRASEACKAFDFVGDVMMQEIRILSCEEPRPERELKILKDARRALVNLFIEYFD